MSLRQDGNGRQSMDGMEPSEGALGRSSDFMITRQLGVTEGGE